MYDKNIQKRVNWWLPPRDFIAADAAHALLHSGPPFFLVTHVFAGS